MPNYQSVPFQPTATNLQTAYHCSEEDFFGLLYKHKYIDNDEGFVNKIQNLKTEYIDEQLKGIEEIYADRAPVVNFLHFLYSNMTVGTMIQEEVMCDLLELILVSQVEYNRPNLQDYIRNGIADLMYSDVFWKTKTESSEECPDPQTYLTLNPMLLKFPNPTQKINIPTYPQISESIHIKQIKLLDSLETPKNTQINIKKLQSGALCFRVDFKIIHKPDKVVEMSDIYYDYQLYELYTNLNTNPSQAERDVFCSLLKNSLGVLQQQLAKTKN